MKSVHRVAARHAAVLAGALLAAALPAAAAGPQVRARFVAPARLAAGAKGTIAVEMELGGEWHVNSHTPSRAYLVPTSLELTASNGSLSEVRYPQHVLRRFEFADEPIAVYEGKVRLVSELSVPASASGTIVLGGVLRYQACTDQQCYPPVKANLDAVVAVAGRPTGAR